MLRFSLTGACPRLVRLVGDRGRSLYETFAEQEDWLGLLGLDYYYSDLYYYLEHEDDDPNYMEHFWDHHTDLGLGMIFANAYDRANWFWGDPDDLLSHSLFYEYVYSGAPAAYGSLGRVAHLVADMGVPAHVLNDPHYTYEFYEKTYIHNGYRPDMVFTDIYQTSSLHQLMLVVNDISDNWPSDDRDAHEGPSRTTFFVYNIDGHVVTTQPDWSASSIANTAFRAAVGHTSGLLRMFYNIVCPHVGALGPINMVLKGTDPDPSILYMTNTSFHDVGCQYGKLYYSTAPTAPDPFDMEAWTSLIITSTKDEQGKFVFDLSIAGLGSFNDTLWIMGKVWDNRYSDSHPAYLGHLSIDSTRPDIQNLTVTD